MCPAFLRRTTASCMVTALLRRLPIPLAEIKAKVQTLTISPGSDSAASCLKLHNHFLQCSRLDDDGDERHNRAMVASDSLKSGNPNPARTHLTDDRAGYTSYNSSLVSYGVALVRTIEVGEPSAFVIIALGIMGLASRRFKK